ncbi:MAG: AsmA-like C-terminal region-containing protein [Roseiarcus sp.]
MRTVLTFLALLLVAALTAALVAPLFVDWSHQRSRIEAALTRELGVEVSTAGPIEARLLPTPYIAFAKLEVGPRDAPAFVSARARFELAVGSLMSAHPRFSDVHLDNPVLALDLAALPEAGSLGGILAATGVEKLVVRGGRLVLKRGAAAPVELERVDFDASGSSLAGPLHVEGAAATGGGERVGFIVAAQQFAHGALPIKAEVQDDARSFRAEFEGGLGLAGGRASFGGTATFSGVFDRVAELGEAPWKVTGALQADATSARLDQLVASVGADLSALTADGEAEAEFAAAPKLTIGLTSKELNVDGLLRRENEESAPPSRAFAVLAALGARLDGDEAPAFDADIAFSTPSLYLGAETLDNVSLALQARPGRPLAVDFHSGLPGQGEVKLDGGVEFSPSRHFSGKFFAHDADIAALGAWAGRGDAELAAKAEALASAMPYGEVSARGNLEASEVGFSLRNLALTLDRTTSTGALAFTAPEPPARGRLFLDLDTDALDIDSMPDLTSGAFWLGDFDLSLSLSARRLRIAHAGGGAVESGSLALEASRDGDVFELRRLAIAGLGGASVEAEGAATPTSRRIRVKLDAAHLRDFAALIARVAPNAYTRGFVSRADALSPVRATLEARREGAPEPGPFPFDFVTAKGEARGARFDVKISNAPAPVDALGIEASVEAPDGGVFLAPFGYAPPSLPIGPAEAKLSATGDFGKGFDATLEATFAGARVAWKGRFAPLATGDDPIVFGTATLKSDNVLTALAPLKIARPPAGVAAPVDLSADFALRGEKLALPRVAGVIAGSKVAADLSWTPRPEIDLAALSSDVAKAEALAGETSPPAGGFRGEISLDRASAVALLMLPLGPLAAANPSRGGPAKFAEPLVDPPLADVALKIGALDLGDGVAAKGVAAELGADRGKYRLADAAFDVGTAHVTGRATLRRDGAVAAVNGAFAVQRLDVDRPAVKGRLSLAADFAASGASPSQLVAGFVGEGRLTTSGLTLPRLDPDALGRVMAKAESAGAAIDETNIQHALSQELDKAPLALPDGEVPLTLASGVISAGPVEIEGPQRRASVSGAFDLKNFDFSAAAHFETFEVGKFWAGAAPAIDVTSSGPLDAPARRIDDGALTAGLAAQAIARESDRIATLEADLRERAAFNRRIKAQEFTDRRERELQEFYADQQRKKMEAERQRVMDALQKAADEKAAAEKAAAEAAAEQAARDKAAAAAAAVPVPPAAPAPPAPQTPKPPPAQLDPAASGIY